MKPNSKDPVFSAQEQDVEYLFCFLKSPNTNVPVRAKSYLMGLNPQCTFLLDSNGMWNNYMAATMQISDLMHMCLTLVYLGRGFLSVRSSLPSDLGFPQSLYLHGSL